MPHQTDAAMSDPIVLKVAMMCAGCSGAVERVLTKMEGAISEISPADFPASRTAPRRRRPGTSGVGSARPAARRPRERATPPAPPSPRARSSALFLEAPSDRPTDSLFFVPTRARAPRRSRRRRVLRREPRDAEGDGQGHGHAGGGDREDRQDREGGRALERLTRYDRTSRPKYVSEREEYNTKKIFTRDDARKGVRALSFTRRTSSARRLRDDHDYSSSLFPPPRTTFPNRVASSGCSAHSSSSSGKSRPSHAYRATNVRP